MFTLYTPQTADKALPEVKRLFEDIIVQKNHVVAVQEEIQTIIDSGNPYEGLLDFPSRRFDEEVWLCWKVGETKVKFWHGKEEGFMGRKPLESTGVIEP